MIRTISVLLVLLLLLAGCSGSDEQPRPEPESSQGRILEYTSEISFLTPESEPVSAIRAAVADNDHTRSQGLMEVTDLPEDAGMLFIFEENEPRSFWMANTPISLDIIFVNEDLEIVRIHRNTPPYSHESIRSEAPARYVIEVNAGYTLEHDITEGMSVQIEEL